MLKNEITKYSIALITDSTCDITPELISRYSIQVVPQIVIWGDQEFRDRVTIQPEEFYERLKKDPLRPTSAHATAQDFSDAYHLALQNGANEILVLTVSAAMSGTFQTASLAAKQMNIPVKVIDSKGPTMSLGWQVLAAARAREAGANLEEMAAATADVRKTLTQFVGMESIEYLQSGGRIGNAAKWVGVLLNIRPVVFINHETGLVEPSGLARARSKMIEMLYRKFFERMERSRKLHIAVMHGNAKEDAEALAERIRLDYDPVELLIHITGPVLGINTGPNALALCGYME